MIRSRHQDCPPRDGYTIRKEGAYLPDIELICPECQQPFPYTEEEQALNAESAFPPPTFCPTCHRQRKAAKEEIRNRQRRGSKRRR